MSRQLFTSWKSFESYVENPFINVEIYTIFNLKIWILVESRDKHHVYYKSSRTGDYCMKFQKFITQIHLYDIYCIEL